MTPNRPKYTLSYLDNFTNGVQNTFAYITSLINPKNQKETWSWEFNSGKNVTAIDRNNFATNNSFNDPFNRLTEIVKAGAYTEIAYSSPNEVNVNKDQAVSSDHVLRTQLIYDGWGRLTENRLYDSKTQYISTTNTYDPLGRLFIKTNPSIAGDGLNLPITYLYDELGRGASVIGPDNSVSRTTYAGNVTIAIDPAQKTRATTVDGLGRVTSVVEDPGVSNYVTRYSYDAMDNLICVN